MAELERTLGAAELEEWIAFYESEPFGAYRDNMHAAMIAATIANGNRARGSEPVAPSQFMLGQSVDLAAERTGVTLDALRALALRSPSKRRAKKQAARHGR